MTFRHIIVSCLGIAIGIFTVLAGPVSAAEQDFDDPIIGEKGYYVGTYGDDAYWVSDGASNSMFIVYEEGVVVVDAPSSYANHLPAAIAEVTDKPVTHFIYSHYHKDHTGGAGMFGRDVTYIGHTLTKEELLRVRDPNRPVPSVVFDDTYTLTVGDQRVELAYHGLNHTPGNISIFLPKQKVLMLVDIVYPAVVPFADLGIAAHVPGYYKIIEAVLEYEFDSFQGGHLGRPGTREEFNVAREYVLDLRASAHAALGIIQPPVSVDPLKNPIENPYHPFAAYLDAASAACAEIVTQKWGDRLKGTASFTQRHCWTSILESIVD